MKEDAYYQFWQDLPDDLDPAEIGEMTYNDGITAFPLEVLTPLWLKELGEVGLSKVDGSTGIPQKAESPHTNQWDRPLEGDVRPVTLGESRKGAWIRFDGPRTE